MRKYFIWALAVLLPALSSADSRGFSPYAIFSPAWHCDEMLAAYGQVPELRLSTWWNVFGTSTACWNKTISTFGKRLKLVEIGLGNGSCLRFHRCGTYEFPYDPRNPGRWAAFATDAYNKLIPQLDPDTLCLVNPFVESNYDQATQKGLLDITYKAFKGRCFVVNNPVGGLPGAAPIPFTLFEQHGPSHFPLDVFNNDGSTIQPTEFPGIAAQYASNKLTAYWSLGDNCNLAPGGFIDPRRRNACSRMSQFLASVAAVKTPLPPPYTPPTTSTPGCVKIIPFLDGVKRGNVWKEMDAIPAGQHRTCGGHVTDGVAVLLSGLWGNVRHLRAYIGNAIITDFCFAGLRTEDHTNRPMFRSNRHINEFSSPLTLKDEFGHCSVIQNASQRAD